MRTPLYRAVVALLDLCQDPAFRASAWRAIDALRLSDEDIAEVTRRLDVDDTGDDRRAKTWAAYAACIHILPASDGAASRRVLRAPDPPRSRGALRLVAPSEPVESPAGSGRQRP